jgi:hypothetical protein
MFERFSFSAVFAIGVVLASYGWSHGQSGPVVASLRPIQQDSKWGYIDRSGKIAIKPQFSWAEEFSEGLAAFENEDGKHGYIDETGKIVIEPKFDNWTNFSEGLAAVSVDFKWGYIDRNGKWVIPPQFAVGRPFSNGLALVGVPLSGNVTFPPGPVKHEFIDKDGKIAINPEHDILNGSFSEGFAAVQFITKNGIDDELIDKTGKTLVAVQDLKLRGFSGGLAAVKKDGKWGYVGMNGNFLIEPQFEEAESFSEGLAAVKVDKKWGYIDRQGAKIIMPIFEFTPGEFSEGLALVFLNGECTYIDKTGQVAFHLRCDDAEGFDGGLAYVHIGKDPEEKRAYVNKRGDFVWGPVAFKYKSLEEIRARAEKRTKQQEVLTPLTDDERSLNLRDVILNQPDFVADFGFFVGEGFGAYSWANRLARKGTRYREESQFWTFVGDVGKGTARLYPQAKVYDDMEPPHGITAERILFNPSALAKDSDASFTGLGTLQIDGHNCIKIKVVRAEKSQEIYLYLARDLRNLAIAAVVIEPKRSITQSLHNISLEVPDSMVQIPSEYKPIEHDRWTKLETAKLTYKDKPSKDFGVFRAPGGELFIWIKDAYYPWEYLVRPKQGTVEIAFQGLLVTRSGEYIWRTNETEAFSQLGYRVSRPRAAYETEEDTHAAVTPNSVKFRSRSYERDKAMIEVSW